MANSSPMSNLTIIKEVWSPIKNFIGYYEISNFGNVKRIKVCRGTAGGKIKTYLGNGYSKVDLYISQKRKKSYIHRLIAEAFIPNHQNKSQINHIDNNRANNAISNLEWTTQKENIHHCIKSGRKINKTKITNEQVLFIRKSNLSAIQLSKIFDVDPQVISRIINCKTRKNI